MDHFGNKWRIDSLLLIIIFHRTPINYLLVNLAVADMLYATLITPDSLLGHTSIHPNGMGGTVLCKLMTGGSLAWVAGTSSIVSLIAIAAERHYAVVYPAGNIGKLTKRKLKVRHWRSVNTCISNYRVMIYELRSLFSACICIIVISKSNWTSCRTIQGVIGRVISKLDKREAGDPFELRTRLLHELCDTRSNY